MTRCPYCPEPRQSAIADTCGKRACVKKFAEDWRKRRYPSNRFKRTYGGFRSR